MPRYVTTLRIYGDGTAIDSVSLETETIPAVDRDVAVRTAKVEYEQGAI